MNTDADEKVLLLLTEYADLHRRYNRLFLVLMAVTFLCIITTSLAVGMAARAAQDAANLPPPSLRFY